MTGAGSSNCCNAVTTTNWPCASWTWPPARCGSPAPPATSRSPWTSTACAWYTDRVGRLLLIGAGQLSLYVADMAAMLDFEVLVCDPREEFRQGWETRQARFIPGMPDDAVLAIRPDERTAVVALTHDPRLDDLALLTALQSDAFYVGALGSLRNNDRRRERLLQLEVPVAAINRLHGPIGLHIGSHTPPEIALSLLAEVVAVKNGIALTQKKRALVAVEQVA